MTCRSCDIFTAPSMWARKLLFPASVLRYRAIPRLNLSEIAYCPDDVDPKGAKRKKGNHLFNLLSFI